MSRLTVISFRDAFHREQHTAGKLADHFWEDVIMAKKKAAKKAAPKKAPAKKAAPKKAAKKK